MRAHLRRRQRGVALFAVLVFMLLSMLLALWASHTALFNELVVSNDADYQRAYEAAEALLQDAELDIRGENADGTPCAGTGAVCRKDPGIAQIPGEEQEIGPLLADLQSQTATGGCRNALCIKRMGRQDFWNFTGDRVTPAADATRGEVPLAAMQAAGARYGQYTGAATGSDGAPINPILSDRSAANRGGYYWIEVLPYDRSSQNASLIVPADDAASSQSLLPLYMAPYVVYRITALAYGRKADTMVVLQQGYARQRPQNP
ncbi:MAG: pilus assembly protein PilX [Burkholderiaceae bacterium]|jgi:type IV pilus assembly protein PilX|nr:pilus assembly protein PilX [Burkholderiaceae bacterium]